MDTGFYKNRNSEPATVNGYLFLYVFPFLLSFLAFIPGLFGEFLFWDDHHLILLNSELQQLGFTSFFANLSPLSDYYAGKPYWPVRDFANLIILRLFGNDPFYFHIFSLTLHLLTTILLFFVVKRFSKSEIAYWAAIFFYIHPQKVEPVVWIAGTKETLSGFFCLLTFYLYLRWRDAGKKQHLILSYITFSIGLLSKWNTVILIPILFFTDFFFHLNPPKLHLSNTPYFKRIETYIDRFIFLCLTGLLFLLVFFHGQDGGHPIQPASFQTVPKMMVLYFLYFWKWVIPIHLNPLLEAGSGKNSLPLYWAAISATLFFLFFAVVSFVKGREWVSFLIVWWFLWLSPYIGFFETTINMADRYAYMSSIAPSILCGVLAAYLLERNKKLISKFLILSLVLCLSFNTFYYSLDWSDSFRFWNMAIERNPKSPRCRFYRGFFLLNAYDVFHNFNPTSDPPPLKLRESMGIYDLKKTIQLALEKNTNSLQNKKIMIGAYREIIEHYLKNNNLAECESMIVEVGYRFPKNSDLLNLMGVYYSTKEHYKLAIEKFRRVLDLSPDNIPAKLNLSLAFAINGDLKKAEEMLGQAKRKIRTGEHLSKKLADIEKRIELIKNGIVD